MMVEHCGVNGFLTGNFKGINPKAEVFFEPGAKNNITI